MNVDAVEDFRARLSGELRTAMKKQDREAVSTLRCIMSALDNAGAVAQEAAAGSIADSPTEVPRRRLSAQAALKILRAEIEEREAAARDYDRIRDAAEAEKLRDGAAMIEKWMVLLTQSTDSIRSDTPSSSSAST